ncbi:MAG TPA: lipase maturation factor family protein [Thermoanaerobaculia bacterium]|nr:lipase maturation factor family protein [Thermoanaerobaculia bacterium]
MSDRRFNPMQRTASVEESCFLLRALLLRLLGVVFLIAFVSLWLQVDGLVGSRGILPVDGYAERAREALGAARWWKLPSLVWLDPADWMLHALCAAGVALSALLALGVATVPVVAALWAAYLSLAVAGQVFLQFQWDSLLLETALCSLFLAPWTWRPGRPVASRPDPALGVWLWRLLALKLMVLSGAVKLLSFDDSWWRLDALEVHFETQPLPLWTAWYAHHLAPVLQRGATLVVLVVEIAVPFLMFWNRPARRVAAGVLIGVQALIAATGSYGFFNLLSIVLCLSLLDDAAVAGIVPRRWRQAAARRGDLEGPLGGWLPAWKRGPLLRRAARWSTLRSLLAGAVVLASALVAARELVWSVPPRREMPQVLEPVAALVGLTEPALAHLSPFRSINGYGLFRAMTRERPEIVVEASDDGESWLELRFRWKPGDLTRRPRLVAPHMPRLDWQMWFAALDPRGADAWLQGLLYRLGTAEPAVLDLLAETPFGERPPRYLRLVLYQYRFTTPAERAVGGAWWSRERLGALTGPLATAGWPRQPR